MIQLSGISAFSVKRNDFRYPSGERRLINPLCPPFMGVGLGAGGHPQFPRQEILSCTSLGRIAMRPYVFDNGACRGAKPLCVSSPSPFCKGGSRGIGLGNATGERAQPPLSHTVKTDHGPSRGIAWLPDSAGMTNAAIGNQKELLPPRPACAVGDLAPTNRSTQTIGGKSAGKTFSAPSANIIPIHLKRHQPGVE
jgi:hypothetical protein